MSDRILEVDHVTKEYRLGKIGTGTLQQDLKSWWARKRGKEDPNLKIGARVHTGQEYFNAIDDVSFSVDRRDAIGLVGRNGAGKSTMLKLISRITAPTQGEIRIRGRVASLLEVGTGFHQELTGRENVYLNGAILGMPRSETDAKMNDIIEFSEISQFIDTPVKRYSSGMYVKLAFAVAAHLDPDLMICDEVLAVGDQAFQQKCIAKMTDLAADGRAIIYVSHNMRTVAQLCNRGLFLDHGKLGYDGTPEHAIELYNGSGARSTVVELDDLPRYKKHLSLVHMTRLTIENSATLEFEQDTDIVFKLDFNSRIRETGMRIRVVLSNSFLNPIGMTQSDAFDTEPDRDYAFKLRLNLDGLAAGEYIIKLVIANSNMSGGSTTYDALNNVFRFIIRDDPVKNCGLLWRERNWGNYRLSPLEIL